MIIDSHVNLHAPQFDDDREAVIDRARAAGVGLMVNICDRVSNFPACRAIAEAPDIWCTVGTHPHEAKDDPDLAAATLVDLAADPRVVGIGECGLDFHYDLSPRDIQARVFRAHCAAARETEHQPRRAYELPLVCPEDAASGQARRDCDRSPHGSIISRG